MDQPPPSMLWKTTRRLIISVVGGTIVLIGLVGLLMPIMPGWPLLIPGLALLATEFVWARLLLRRMKRTFRDLFRSAKRVA